MNAQLTVVEPEELEFLPAKTLLRLLERQQTTSKNYKLFKHTVGELPELFRSFEEMDLDTSFNLDNDWVSLTFTGDGHRLAEVWRLLRRHGYNTYARPKKGDTAFAAFWNRDGHAQLFMNFSSSVCRRVQVGTKMVEQPIYETQCGEMPDMVEAPASAVVVAEGSDDDCPF